MVEVWNAAAGDAFPLTERLFRQNTFDDPHFDPAGCHVARAESSGRVLGFCLAKVARESLAADGLLPDRGWISMIAVRRAAQRRGVGTALLRAGEAFLRARRRSSAVLGGDPAHFFPGVPDVAAAPAPGAADFVPSPAARFFEARGYALRGEAYDLRRSLCGYRTPAAVVATLAAHPEVAVRPFERGEEGALLAFLDRTFPGRWRYTAGRFLECGGAIADMIGVLQGAAIVGFAHLFHPGSRWLGPSIAWVPRSNPDAGPKRPRPRAAGGLGPMGLAPEWRDRGLGLALLDRSMRHLGGLGVETMVIDWTILLDFYRKLGFAPCRRYRHGERRLAD